MPARSRAPALLPLVALMALVALVGACGGASVDAPVDGYLRVGVDAHVECDSVRDSLAEAGLELRSRVEQFGYCALSAASSDERRTAVRVVTARGIVYSADGEVGGLPGATPVAFLAPPGGHAGTELLVARAGSELVGRCVDVVRVDDAGGAQTIPLDLAALAATVSVEASACISDVLDQDGDGMAEAYITVRAPSAAAPHARAPAVRVPLAPGETGFVYVAPPASYWQSERRARAELLAHALSERDFVGAHTIGVELALIARLAGESASAQRGAYDASIAGLSLGAAQQALIDAAHAAFAGE